MQNPRQILLKIILGIFITMMSVSSVLFIFVGGPSEADIQTRVKSYITNPNNYDLIFLGDSRTYCAFHPFLLDRRLGVRSLNLSQWSNWLPTQYAIVDDIISEIPLSTKVVWSIGHQNFNASRIRSVYPIYVRRIPTYVRLGFSYSDLSENILAFNPATWMYAHRARIRIEIENRLNNVNIKIPYARSDVKDLSSQVINHMRDSMISANEIPTALVDLHPNILSQRSFYDDRGNIASIGYRLVGGSYLRHEVNPGYYRNRQIALTDTSAEVENESLEFNVDERMWRIFIIILERLSERGISFIVNELQEAPYTYSETTMKSTRKFLREKVKPEVEKFGGQYISVDFSELENQHYFDYNHLNSIGVLKYTELFVEKISTIP